MCVEIRLPLLRSAECSLVVKYVKGRSNPTSDLEGNVNVESDCDGDSPGVNDKLPTTKNNKEETRAVLTIGSFSACVPFLLLTFSRGK